MTNSLNLKSAYLDETPPDESERQYIVLYIASSVKLINAENIYDAVSKAELTAPKGYKVAEVIKCDLGDTPEKIEFKTKII